MNRKNLSLYIITLVAALFLTVGLYQAKQAMAAEKYLTQITAVYLGDSVEVGGSIDPKDLYVTAYYISNGALVTETVKTGYSLSPATVTSAGTNTIVVIYNGYTASFNVIGKRVSTLIADYTGPEVTVGNDISEGNLKVTAYYTDGTSEEVRDYTLPQKKVTQENENTFVVSYGGVTASFTVIGKAMLAVEELIAYYGGEEVIVGNAIDKSQITAYAIYNNGNMEEITKFNLSPTTVSRAGTNTIVLSYGGKSTTITVEGVEKEIVSVTAEYIGIGVIVGQTVDANEVKVMATYNDGTTARTNAFMMSGSLITYEGENVVLVYCGDFVELIIVPGVEGFNIDYTNSISNIVFGEYGSYSTVTLALNRDTKEDSFTLTQLDNEVVEQAVRRVINTQDYIAYELAYDEDDMIKEFPMAMKVTRPSNIEADKFCVYYTPNQRTIMAKMNGYYTDEEQTEYEFLVYEPGTYILIREISNLLVEEIVVEETVEIKAGRSYSLNPTILPKAAVNKAVTYWSDDESIATVSENGKVKTYEAGVCHIWIEAEDESGVYAIVTLDVKEK